MDKLWLLRVVLLDITYSRCAALNLRLACKVLTVQLSRCGQRLRRTAWGRIVRRVEIRHGDANVLARGIKPSVYHIIYMIYLDWRPATYLHHEDG